VSDGVWVTMCVCDAVSNAMWLTMCYGICYTGELRWCVTMHYVGTLQQCVTFFPYGVRVCESLSVTQKEMSRKASWKQRGAHSHGKA